MKKFLKAAVGMTMAAAMVFGMTACGGEKAEKTDDKASSEIVKLSIGHIYNTNHNEALALESWKEKLAEASDGRIELTIFPSSQLGSEREMAEQVALGTLDMGLSDGPTWSNALNVPELAVFGLPYLYKDIDGQVNAFDEIITVADQYMTPAGVKPLFCTSASIRGAMMVTKPIYTLEDISGIKMRVPEISMYVDTWACLGANPSTTAWGECYTALQQGVMDGCEVDPSTIVDANIHEVAKYFSRTNHMGTVHIISMNLDKWNSIPEDLQQIILDTAAEVSVAQAEDRKVADAAAEQKMVDAGVEINAVEDAELERMKAAVQPLYDQYDKQYGLGETIAKLQAYGWGEN